METIQSRVSRKSQYWHHHVDGWQRSGLSQKAYCHTNSLALATFGYWKRKLGRNNVARRFYPLVTQSPSPMAKSPAKESAPLVLHLDRFLLEISPGCNPGFLKEVIEVLEEVRR
jgi:hypothetical protein